MRVWKVMRDVVAFALTGAALAQRGQEPLVHLAQLGFPAECASTGSTSQECGMFGDTKR